MNARAVAGFVGVLAVLRAAPVLAQEKGQVGVSMGYPASVGIVWQVADRWAIRPEISLTEGSGTSTSTLTVSLSTNLGTQTQTTQTQTSTDTTMVGTGVSGLFYVWKREALSAFVSPRYDYNRGTDTAAVSGSAQTTAPNITIRSHFVSGSFGAQYALGRRFSVFGEIGLGYTHSSVVSPASSSLSSGGVSTTTSSEARSHGLSTRSGVGVVFYFR